MRTVGWLALVLAACFLTGQAGSATVDPNAAGAPKPVALAQSERSGEIGRRINDREIDPDSLHDAAPDGRSMAAKAPSHEIGDVPFDFVLTEFPDPSRTVTHFLLPDLGQAVDDEPMTNC